VIGVAARGADRVARVLRTAGQDLRTTQETIVRVAGAIVHRKVVERMSDPGTSHPFWGRGGGIGDRLAARSGGSRARITPGTQVYRVGDTVSTVVGSPDQHIGFLEEGGTVYGRPYLRVPTAAAKTAQGVDRFAGRSIREIAGAFLQRSRRGILWAMRAVGGRAVELLYMLVRSVRIRGRHVFARARADAEPEIARVSNGAVAAVVRKANRG